jgi:hypothetical protein
MRAFTILHTECLYNTQGASSLLGPVMIYTFVFVAQIILFSGGYLYKKLYVYACKQTKVDDPIRR